MMSSALLPALLGAVPADAADKKTADKKTDAPKKTAPPKEKLVSRKSGDLKYSFKFSGKDFEEQKEQGSDQARFERKDGSFITMKATEKGHLKKRLFKRDGPGNGFKLETFQEGSGEDILEWTKLPTVEPLAASGGAQPGGFLFIGQGDADPTSYHQWYRQIHGSSGEALITVGINSAAFAQDEKMFRDIVNSFKLD